MTIPLRAASGCAAVALALLCASALAQEYRYGPDYRSGAYQGGGYYPPPGQAQGPATMPAAIYQDTARVTRIAPRIEQVVSPQEECRTDIERVEAPPQPQGRNVGGVILGGIAGGILGNQVGGGNGRAAATAIGAVGGALVGDRVANNMNGNPLPPGAIERPVRRCNVVNRTVERTAGYDVTYQYNGRSYTTVMPHDPGASLRVNVSVTPAH
jgi:uncharacterized protein YcfJ